MISRYIIGAMIAIAIVFASFYLNFYVKLNYNISDNSAEWGQFGDYVGGLLNPVLSFISVVMLIKSLTLQNEANRRLNDELKNSEKTEKLRTFDTLFFNLINSQKELFNSFKIDLFTNNKPDYKYTTQAVLFIELEIEKIREQSGNDLTVLNYIEQIDADEKIYDLTRAFYISVMLITDKLTDVHGFTSEDRASHIETLINFTNFAQLRLILIGIQFLDFPSTKYLRNNIDFNSVLSDVGLRYDLY